MSIQPRLRALILFPAIAGCLATCGAANAAPGDPDLTFGTNGYLALDQVSSQGREVVMFPNGRSVTMTAFYGTSNDQPAVLRLWSHLSDGSVDTRWGGDGMVEISRRPFSLYSQSLESTKGGGVVVASDLRMAGPDTSVFLKFNRDGSRDDAFSDDGMVTLGGGRHVELCGDIAVRGRGSVTAGFLKQRRRRTYALVRLTPRGERDGRFGDRGVVELDSNSSCGDVEAGPRHTMVMAAYRFDGEAGRYTCIFRRFTRSGELDPSFSGDGRVEIPQGTCDYHTVTDDGAVLTASQELHDEILHIHVERMNPDGEVDSAFGDGGTALVEFGRADYLRGLEIGPRSRIYVGGSSGVRFKRHGFEVAVARLTSEGKLDRSFSEDGMVTTGVRSDSFRRSHDWAEDLAVAPTGDAVLTAGVSIHSENYGYLFKFSGDD